MPSLLNEIQAALHRTFIYPGGVGRGIVIVGGGRFLPSAYIALRQLRALGCGLPVQLWHLGAAELPRFSHKLLAALEVSTVDAQAAPGAADFPRLGGWECKIHAILGCPFEQVLLLDADNIPLIEPTQIFDSAPFTKYRQVFWPDFYYKPGHRYAIRPRAWQELGLSQQTGLELETAQVLMDRRTCWRELQIVKALNVCSQQCYGDYTWGDKDTFTLAWLLTRRPYYTVPLRPSFIQREAASVLWQYWSDGRRMFQHQRKWLDTPQKMASRLLDGELCKEQSMSYLQEFWDAARAAGQEASLVALLSPKSGPAQATAIPRVAASESAGTSGGWHRLGMAAFERGDLSEAVEDLKRAVALSPSNPSYRVDLAALLSKADQPTEAIPHLMHALRIKGDMPEIHNNLGVVLEQLGRFLESAAACRNAIKLRPNYLEAHHNLGKALRKAGDPKASLEAFGEALHLRPDSVPGYDGLVNAAEDLGDVELLCHSLRKLVELQRDAAGVRSSLLYTLHYHPDMDPAALYREHREWDRLFDRHGRELQSFANDPSADRRIKVGYVSPDFREHTVTKFIGAALRHHDRQRFEVFCYSGVAEPDRLTERIRGQVEHWRDIVGLPDGRVEQIVRDDEIDILVDLRGHASGNRMTLFARKPAPVQLNMVGYFDTTGLSAMDYRVTDVHQDPLGQSEQHHTEKLLRLPHTCWCYMADEDAPDVAGPPSELSGHITFGSLNKIVKLTRPCAVLWAGVLQAVPDSRLLLPVVSEQAAEAIRQRLCEAGLPPDRLDLVPKTQSRREYLERFHQIDIALDTFPFNGITTTCDGLWMGVPLVSLAGSTSVSRAGRSILHAAGLGELSALTSGAFVEVAVRLAMDRDPLRSLRLGMRQRLLSSPLMDHLGFTRALENEYSRIWDAWRDGEVRSTRAH